MRPALLLLLCACLCSAKRQVAITIDDLPVAPGTPAACQFDMLRDFTSRLLKPLADGKVPLTAFVIAGNCPGLTDAQFGDVLRIWSKAGAEIGNHTWSHRSLSTNPIAEYEQDILRADERLRKVTGHKPEWFRSPMLHTGPTPDVKQRLEAFLASHSYRQSPVTFDNSDFMFAYVLLYARSIGDRALEARVLTEYVPYMESVIAFFEMRSVELTGREFPQILLMHANQLNLEMLPRLLSMLRKRGYEFVSMREALKDLVYQMRNTYAGKGGFSWIHRWSMSLDEDRKLPRKAEPDEPKWLQEAYQKSRQP